MRCGACFSGLDLTRVAEMSDLAEALSLKTLRSVIVLLLIDELDHDKIKE